MKKSCPTGYLNSGLLQFQVTATNDPVIINAMMFICKTMHDSVNAMTLEDEKKAISQTICGFVRKISFGRDLEQQLNFFVEARAAFTNLDIVLVQLIQVVIACVAHCFITVPFLRSVFSQMQLYLLSGLVALLNQCYSQCKLTYSSFV
ncbi:VP35L-like protein [Mya arenaria]|uniref:VP35L-like protein n=1 Tax=Mya arenaria TaxID=6604 RepID=A0ABY7DG92_MYAAR|nr:VP35L-like protein [Mya arenaria]